MAEETGQRQQRSQSDKDRARQKSRSVQASKQSNASGSATKKPSPAKTNVAAKPSNKKRPSGRPAGRTPSRRTPAALLTWGAVALVVIIVIVLVVVKVTGTSPSATAGTQWTPVADSTVQEVTQIPAAVYDKVGVTSPATQVTPPTVISGQTPLTFDGKPGTLYVGGEFCPYCAAERWAMIAALSRFGTFTNLGGMASNPSDVFPNTQTFTFSKAAFTSPYLTLQAVEQYSNTPSSSGGYTVLTPLTAQQKALVQKYDSTQFLGAGGQAGSIPFINFGNSSLVSGASYSPSILAGLSRDQIASGLSDASNPVTQAIVSTANYLTASICATTGNQPASVCTSKGVTTAAKAMGIGS
jgi:Domain of unknown function (DUF929)